MGDKLIPYISDGKLQITDLNWERIFLNITVQSQLGDNLQFEIADVRFKKETDQAGHLEGVQLEVKQTIPVRPASVSDGEYKFHLNMSVMDGTSFLNNGQWVLLARENDTDDYRACTITYELAYDLDDKSRIFPYGIAKYTYNVCFRKICFDEENITLAISSKFMVENPKWRNIYVLHDRNTLKGKMSCISKKTKMFLLQTLYNILSLIHRKDGKNILFMSETKPYLWGNLKYIHDRLIERGLDKQFKLTCTFRIAVGTNNSFVSWFKTIDRIARQDYIFVDDYAPVFGLIDLRPDTKLIQVWHAGEGFKSVGYSRFGMPRSPYPVKNCHKKYDYAITGSERLVDVYSEVFGLPRDKVLPLGMARLDNYLDKEVIESKTAEFYEAHPECKDKKLILFAPTFRGANQKAAYYDYNRIDMDAVYDFCGNEYIWAFKMHPFVKDKPPIDDKYKDRIIDLGYYKNINDLYYVSDILITDYSSAYFEYSLLKRPVLFYTYDREIYEITRGVHKPILESAPGKVCDSFEDLMKALETKDYDIEKTIKFYEENFGEYDGKAADRIIDTIILQSAQ